MVQLEGETSNSLFDVLEDWNSYLKSENVDPLYPSARETSSRRGPTP
jgi:hypothetical protein